MSSRFFVTDAGKPDVVEILDAEARHITKVMRLGPGAEIVLFDGQGRQCRATIESTGKNNVLVRPKTWQSVSKESTLKIVVAVALPKGDRLKFMVEKMTELGVAEVIPLICTRSNVLPKTNTLVKMRRYVIEASKQCGRNQLLNVHDPAKIEKVVRMTADSTTKIYCDPNSDQSLIDVPQTPTDQVWFLIGPEGGFTTQELECANQANWASVNLGPRILRTETAAISCCALAPALFKP